MSKIYTLRLLLLTLIMAVGTQIAVFLKAVDLPIYNWVGLAYLLLLTLAIHAYVRAASDNGNSLIRRLMVASILRLIAALVFLLITLFNTRPIQVHFVIFYCLYFCAFMVFEISQMRTNLRPDLKPRPKNENA
jgi:protein-S-isoprenylcysteine O-methyltransferase Ste14